MKIQQDAEDFLYNEDRAVASAFGAPPEETISSEVGRHAKTNVFARASAWVLNHIQKNHTANAIKHADILDAANEEDDE